MDCFLYSDHDQSLILVSLQFLPWLWFLQALRSFGGKNIPKTPIWPCVASPTTKTSERLIWHRPRICLPSLSIPGPTYPGYIKLQCFGQKSNASSLPVRCHLACSANWATHHTPRICQSYTPVQQKNTELCRSPAESIWQGSINHVKYMITSWWLTYINHHT